MSVKVCGGKLARWKRRERVETWEKKKKGCETLLSDREDL